MIQTLLLSLVLATSGAKSLQTDAVQHAKALSSPAYEGRMTLRTGNIKAAEYIAKEFSKLGLQPQSGDSFLQPFTIKLGIMAAANSSAQVGGKQLVLGTDFVPLFGSREGVTTGNGVVLGQLEPTREVHGKWAVMWRAGSPLGPRIQSAKDLGAVGVVVVGAARPGGRELPLLQRGQGTASDLGIAAFALSSKAFKEWTGEAAGATLKQPLEVPESITLDWHSTPDEGSSHNVVAMLPGNDASVSDQPIIIGAHYDHLGYGETGSRTGNQTIHAGADDNASGTSGVLALAKYFATTKQNRHPILFHCYSGEEVGLVGSAAWTAQNATILPKVKAMINMDMIGRLRNQKLSISAVGSCADFGPLLAGIRDHSLSLDIVPSSPANSDHASFIARQVPSLFFNTGLHDEYHTERDTFQTLNQRGLGEVVDFVRQTVERIDQIRTKLVFVNPGGSTSGSGDPNSTRRVRVGFIPDMSGGDGLPGMVLGGASPGSPAELAGVKAGDRLLLFDGKPVNSIEDLQAVLMAAKANVEIEIVIQRGTEKKTLKLTPVPAS